MNIYEWEREAIILFDDNDLFDRFCRASLVPIAGPKGAIALAAPLRGRLEDQVLYSGHNSQSSLRRLFILSLIVSFCSS